MVFRHQESNQPEIIDAGVIRFRGETPFTCGIFDETDGEIKDYNLLWVLQNAEVEYMEKADFMQECQTQKASRFVKFRYVDVYLRLREYRSERERFRLTQSRKIIGSSLLMKITVSCMCLRGLKLMVIFQKLTKSIVGCTVKRLLCLVRKEPVGDLRRILRLPMMFSIFPLLDLDGNEFSVVFSKDALLLHSQPYIWSKGGEF